MDSVHATSFVRCRNYTPANRVRCDLVLIHTMEAPEHPKTAENVASWFAGPNAPEASVHYCVDSDSIVQTLEERHVGWGAGRVNHKAIHIEHAGYAGQTPEQWADAFSTAMLERSAKLVADICIRHDIPIAWVWPAELVKGTRGITGHKQCNDAFAQGKGHWDPGPNFPIDRFLDMVKAAASEALGVTRDEGAESGAADALADGLPPWVEVRDDRGDPWLVAPAYIAPVAIGDAEAIAQKHGCELPCPELVDAIFEASDLRLMPHTRAFPNWTQAEMDAREVHDDQAKRIVAEVKGRPFRLLAGAYKDVVRTRGGEIGLYGWHRPDGSIIQPFYAKHAPSWRDYSQGLRLCKRAP